MNYLLSALIFFGVLSNIAHSKLLDKVAGIINNKVFTLSEINRVKNTIAVRQEIAPFIYKNEQYTVNEILRLLQNSFIIKDKLAELGFVINDDVVENRIMETQKGLNLTRKELLQFLESKGITMPEYFELIRDAMEYNVFQKRIISPLITITDQEIKNFYYKTSKSAQTLAYKYEVVSYSLPKNSVPTSDYPRLQEIFNNYRETGNIPAVFSDFSTTDLGKIAGEDLPQDLRSLLKKTNKNSFSEVYLNNDQVQLFFVKDKMLAESNDYLKVKNRIYAIIFQQRSQKITENWLSRESLNYYTLNKL